MPGWLDGATRRVLLSRPRALYSRRTGATIPSGAWGRSLPVAGHTLPRGPYVQVHQEPNVGLQFSDQTVRYIVHTSIGGDRVRVRISNTFGANPIVIGAAHVARRDRGASIVPGTDRALMFSGSPSFTIPAGGLVLSGSRREHLLARCHRRRHHAPARSADELYRGGTRRLHRRSPPARRNHDDSVALSDGGRRRERAGERRRGCIRRLDHGRRELHDGHEPQVAGRSRAAAAGATRVEAARHSQSGDHRKPHPSPDGARVREPVRPGGTRALRSRRAGPSRRSICDRPAWHQ